MPLDSWVILDEKGAVKLLGRGDMLLRLPTNNQTQRIQAAYVSDDEVGQLVAAAK